MQCNNKFYVIMIIVDKLYYYDFYDKFHKSHTLIDRILNIHSILFIVLKSINL